MKRVLKITVLLLIFTLIWGCNQNNSQIVEKGQLMGKISIGPLCPVETDPPDPNCQPTAETYLNWPVVIFTSDNKTKVLTLNPDVDGNYLVDLDKGSYIVDLDIENRFGDNLPTKIDVKANKTVLLDIDIDTGIR
jgi:hypothetical protein